MPQPVRATAGRRQQDTVPGVPGGVAEGSELMITIEVRDGLYHVRGPKLELCLTKAEFIQALRRAKWVNRRETRQARDAPEECQDAAGS